MKAHTRITIVGGGLSGKAFASLLLQKLQAASLQAPSVVIHLLDNQANSVNTNSTSYDGHLYTGLWTKGAQIFHDLVLPTETRFSDYACSVGESGYRAADGQWIMKPYRGMQLFPGTMSNRLTYDCRIVQLMIDLFQL